MISAHLCNSASVSPLVISFIGSVMRSLSRNMSSSTVVWKAGCAPSEGVWGSCDVPFSPWQAKQVGRRSSSDCAPSGSADKPARMAPTARLRMWPPENVGKRGRKEKVRGRRRAALDAEKGSATGGRSLGAVAHPVDCAVVVVRDQQRAVLHHQDIDRPSDIIVVLEEAGNERLHRPEGAVRLELHQYKITSDLGAAVPGAMARDDDVVAIGGREHGAGVEAHPQSPRVWAQQRERLGELIARVPPSELLVRDVALVAVGVAEIVLAGLSHSVEFVLGDVFRQPVATVFGEVELLGGWVPVHPDDLTDAGSDDFQPAAVQIETVDLGMALGRHADVARRADLEIELLVGPDGEIFPTVSFVLRQVTEDDGRLRRVVELVFDVFDFRDLGELGDVERALVQDDAVRAIEPGGEDLHLALSAFVDDGVDFVLDAA